MKKIKYLFKRIISMDYGKMLNTARKISKKTNKLYLSVLSDIVYCGFKHGAGYVDYDVFEMYNLNEKQRKTYVTRERNNEIISKCNDKSKAECIDDKSKFNKIYNKYLKRDWIFINENKDEILNWISKRETFIAKDIKGTCGKEVKKIDVKNYLNVQEIYDELIEKNYLLLEEYVIQHEKMMSLCPNSVNTIRIVSFLKNDDVCIIKAFLRIGNGGVVDNLNSGGITVPINDDTGIIEDVATDKEGNIYTEHPLTKVKIKGFSIPYWIEAINMVKEASKILPEVRYVGWDVAITNNGPLFIEGNPFPGHDIYQLPSHIKDKIGIMPMFEKINWKE